LPVLTRVLRAWAPAGAMLLALAAASPQEARAGADLRLIAADRTTTLDLSLEALESLPQTTIVTENEFANGMVAYRGPLMRDVLAQFGLDHVGQVRLVAANDYFVDVPTEDFRAYDAILAMEANGKPLSRRDKGPLWLMYPISDHPELNDPSYLRRLIWQLVRIEAL
jgi:hypothetical protein